MVISMKENQKKRFVRGSCVALALSILICCFTTGCKKKAEQTNSEDITLTFWCELSPYVMTSVSNYAETEFYKALKERTGVDVKFIHPAAGNVNEQFNVMLASGEYPDMIQRDWSSYPGGEAKACEDGILIDFTDDVKEYMPNMYKYMKKKTPNAERWVTTNGRYYIVPSLADYTEYTSTQGPVIRNDLLKQVGLDVPTTIDEWEVMLKAFKDAGVKYPLSFTDFQLKAYYPLIGAYGVTRTFLQDNGVMKYGYIEPGMKEFIIRMKSWIDQGLVDPDIMTMDMTTFNGKVSSGNVGAWFGGLGTISDVCKEIQQVKPDAEIIGAPYPTLEKGDECKIIYIDRRDGYTFQKAVGITTANKHPKETLKWLDYAFSDEGHMLYNFGVEGESYTMVDGKPKYTELITNNPNGLTMTQALALWTRPDATGYVDIEYMNQIYNMPQQQQAARMWSENANKYEHVPTWKGCLKFTAEEGERISELNTQYSTYAEEYFAKFLFGEEPISKFDEYAANLRKMGVDEVLKIYQNAYDRVMKK